MKKRCTKCGKLKPESSFYPRSDRPGRSSFCIECWAARHRKYYASRKEYYRQKRRKSKNSIKQILDAEKSKPCMDCGESYPPYVMEFDHREGEKKVANLNWLLKMGKKTAALAEIKKCDVVCANCHRERSHQRRLKEA